MRIIRKLGRLFLKPYSIIKIENKTAKDLAEILKDLPRHRVFSYVNRSSVNSGYFESAEKTLDNGYIYIVLSSTGSPAGEFIRRFTRKEFSHSSLSFDENLETIISYNGGENIYSPGLNQEMIEYFNKKPDANFIVYKIKAGREQKEKILEEIKLINNQGSSYNVLGLFLPYSPKKNIMLCSQFVYTMLKVGELNYFNKRPEQVRPMDFVELDQFESLEYCNRIFINQSL